MKIDETNNNAEETSWAEDDFHPVSESSRISSEGNSMISKEAAFSPCPPLSIDEDDVSRSISKASSRRSPVSQPIPPQSPRTLIEEPSQEKSPFYVDRNIDGIPERNSPREKPVQVSVIRYAPGQDGGELVISPRTPRLLSTSSKDIPPSPQVTISCNLQTPNIIP